MGDHSDVVSIEERDRTYRAPSRFDLPTSKGGSDQVSQSLRAAPVPSVPHESVERFQDCTFERDTNQRNGHSRPRIPQDATATRRSRSIGDVARKVLMRYEHYF